MRCSSGCASSACRCARTSRSIADAFLARDGEASSPRSSSSPIRTIRPATLFPVDDIERIMRAAPGLVVIDEAYQPFAGSELHAAAGGVPEPGGDAHRVQARPGRHCGWATSAAGRSGSSAVQQDALALQRQRADRRRWRHQAARATGRCSMRRRRKVLAGAGARCGRSLRRCRALTVYPSAANFFLVARAGGRRHAAIRRRCKRQGVLVRNFSGGIRSWRTACA